ncbi:hypothetical protein GF386_04515 [Candidatus Pacearchaeota archaeon]|nr:hypothetical protein [Candidatus Pacearchaeota archaeon]MBD3283388.1 hypothetical protein [Candidatus Pacearchaeota archaeon]
MKISELNVGQGNINVEGTLKEIGEKRSFNKFGRELSVANAILEDDSGFIKLSLWNEDVDRFKEGDRIRIVNGYVNEFQGEKQLTSGKYGKIEFAGEGGEESGGESSESSGGQNESQESKSEEGSEDQNKKVVDDFESSKEDDVNELAEDLSESEEE